VLDFFLLYQRKNILILLEQLATLMLFHFKRNNWLNLFNVGKRVMNPNKAMNTFIINFPLIHF